MSRTITDATCTSVELDKNDLHDTLPLDNTNLKTLSIITKHNPIYKNVTPNALLHYFPNTQRLKSR